ncbi:hypothetical protein B0H17DRAFT_189089 [Mycena rosella]|uniref:Uncharacterized protein n=1 Tax=Mycena rosella TaxID=1033263 RepID=A0AAD7DXR3_MYCRO|nr:hypothetical protein B0H17DRAFT_189089 [Mycena rosella]
MHAALQSNPAPPATVHPLVCTSQPVPPRTSSFHSAKPALRPSPLFTSAAAPQLNSASWWGSHRQLQLASQKGGIVCSAREFGAPLAWAGASEVMGGVKELVFVCIIK